jgi:hypothetical protein
LIEVYVMQLMRFGEYLEANLGTGR